MVPYHPVYASIITNMVQKGGYTNNDTLPEWGIQASYLGCLPAAGVWLLYGVCGRYRIPDTAYYISNIM